MRLAMSLEELLTCPKCGSKRVVMELRESKRIDPELGGMLWVYERKCKECGHVEELRETSWERWERWDC